MLKKVILTLCAITLSLSSVTFAQTREELLDNVVQTLDLSTSAQYKLYRYSDWSYTSPQYKKTVSDAVNLGIFVPDGSQLQPQKQFDAKDLETLTRGLEYYFITSDTFRLLRGEIVSTEGDQLSVRLDNGEIIEFVYDTPYISTSFTNCAPLKNAVTGSRICLAQDISGEIDLVWHDRVTSNSDDISAYNFSSIYRGDLFLYDESRGQLILQNPELLELGNFQKQPDKYMDVFLHDDAQFNANGAPFARNRVIPECLDQKIYILVGNSGQKIRILYANILY